MKAKGTTAELLLLLLQIQMTTEELLLFLQMLLYVHRNLRLIRDGGEGGMEVGEREGDYIPVATLSPPE